MSDTCGICEGIEPLTPTSISNRPGLHALAYRVVIHATFLETMLARLPSLGIPLNELDTLFAGYASGKEHIYPLRGLTTRSNDDPAIAFLDAWAVVADVLTFYQERIANEGYLRTATERRSIQELARLIGYTLRPGVASSVYLSYTLENGQKTTLIPKGSRAQSIPGPGQMPQSFETSEDFEARATWNAIKPKMQVTQYITQVKKNDTDFFTDKIYTNTSDGALYLKGTGTNLKVNDPVLFVFGDGENRQVAGHIKAVEPHSAEQYTKVMFPTEFTPCVFFKDFVSLLNLYQNVDAFGLVASDPMVKAIVEEIEGELAHIHRDANIVNAGLVLDYLHDHFRIISDLFAFCFILDKSLSKEKEPPKDAENSLKRLLGIYVETPVQADELVERVDNWLNAGRSSRSRFASWIAGLINDMSALVRTISDFRSNVEGICSPPVTTSLASLVAPLAKLPLAPPADSTRLRRDAKQIFARKSDIAPQLIVNLNQAAGSHIYTALAHADVTGDPATTNPSLQDVYALCVKAAPFGSNAPRPAKTTRTIKDHNQVFTVSYDEDWPLEAIEKDSASSSVLYLDARYDQIVSDSWLVIACAGNLSVDNVTILDPLQVCKVKQAEPWNRTGYGLSTKVTKLTLDRPWYSVKEPSPGIAQPPLPLLAAFRGITVYAQSEKLEVADIPISDDISGSEIELDDLYDGLQSGRFVVVSGERSDIRNTSGIKTSELVMLSSVEQRVREVEVAFKTLDYKPPYESIPLPGDKTHTFLRFSSPLQYTYKRGTVTVSANVVHATHGETRIEVLGSGDGSKAMQQFPLRQSPLTYISAPTASGTASTLKVYVNDIQWQETDNLAGQGSKDRVYATSTDDQSKTTVTFGDGQRGARAPTGIENVRATYRTGIGQAGNVDAGQISLLVSRPLGVKGVTNPAAATGGADRESPAQARRNAPLAVTALDRLVSVQDYADFARTYAGIGKASAVLLSDGSRRLVHLTIAGSENIPIDPSADLFRNLFLSLRTHGNPSLPLQLALCEVKLLVISARVQILPDYMWEAIVQKIRTAMKDAFGFEQRALGQHVFQSEVLSAIQNVEGVAYVDLDIMDAVDQPKLLKALDQIHLEELQAAAGGTTPDMTRDLAALLSLKPQPYIPVELAQRDKGGTGILPAQLAFLSPDVPDTLIINEFTAKHSLTGYNRHGNPRSDGVTK